MLPALLRDSISEHIVRQAGTPMKAWPTLLVVDSDAEMMQILVCFFEKRGFHVAAAGSLDEAKEFFHRRKSWTLVISDYHLPDGTGWELCTWIREHAADTPFLLMSGSPYSATLCAGADYLPKPFPPEKLEAYVRTLPSRA